MILADTLSRTYLAAQTEEISFSETMASLSSVDAKHIRAAISCIGRNDKALSDRCIRRQ